MKVLITGGTNGMGKGLAKILAENDDQNHEIIILGRSEELGEATVKELEAATRNTNISFLLCDLSKLSDVRKAIEEIQHQHAFLDGLFINAGLGYAPKRIETQDGMDPHFQVNYLSHFMLTLNLLDLLEKSEHGGRVVFNATNMGDMVWDDIQLEQKWGYEKAIGQGMMAKRLFYAQLHDLYANANKNVSFFGFQISKTVWSNQINIIPLMMKTMATIMKFFGTFISIEECGRIMVPLFTESQAESLNKSGKLISWKKGEFFTLEEDATTFDKGKQEKLWKISLELCNDEKTSLIADRLKN